MGLRNWSGDPYCGSMANLLFVCSQNWRRSLTAEKIFPGSKSAGTEPTARTVLDDELIRWADIIFAMEKEHEEAIRRTFENILSGRKIVTLSIPDHYRAMDPDLIERLQAAVSLQCSNVAES